MISAHRIVAVLAAAGVAATIALTPTTDSNAFDAKAGGADISARHGQAIR